MIQIHSPLSLHSEQLINIEKLIRIISIKMNRFNKTLSLSLALAHEQFENVAFCFYRLWCVLSASFLHFTVCDLVHNSHVTLNLVKYHASASFHFSMILFYVFWFWKFAYFHFSIIKLILKSLTYLFWCEHYELIH